MNYNDQIVSWPILYALITNTVIGMLQWMRKRNQAVGIDNRIHVLHV